MNLQRFELLDLMGVTLWKERKNFLQVKEPRMGAFCFVLLHEKIKNAEEERVFSGMLKVLALKDEQYCVAWMDRNKGSMHDIMMEIKSFFPKALLVMGQILKSDCVDIEKDIEKKLQKPYQITYHPSELLVDQSKKRQAYQDLLAFKEKLIN